MTAYGRGEYSTAERTFLVEIKSVNNRYKDIFVRMSKELQILEDEIRSEISSRIKRGRLEVSVQVDINSGDIDYDVELNLPLVRSYVKIYQQIIKEFNLNKEINLDAICQRKDVILIKPEETDIDEMRSGIHDALSLALDSLDEMRTQEGIAIEKDFRKRLNLIVKYLDNIEEKSPLVVEEYKKKLHDRIRDLSQHMEIDENRLAQEVAIFADKCDITEEIVRAKSHVEQFEKYLSKEDSIGRRLDFILQEINREFNTLSAKGNDSFISGWAVEVKAELEKLREQVQNVE